MPTDQEEDCFLTLWMATKHILWPGDVKCDFSILWMSTAEDFFSLPEKECQSLQVILKVELQVLARNELGNIKGGRGKMNENENETEYITFSGIKVGEMGLSERRQFCTAIISFQRKNLLNLFIKQADFYLPQRRKVLMYIHITWHLELWNECWQWEVFLLVCNREPRKTDL